MSFIRSVVSSLGYTVRNRSGLTSAGAVGTIVIAEDIDSETGCRIRNAMPVYGDLKNVDLILCGQGGSLMETKPDMYGNDLLRNVCESQDTDNVISKKLAQGELPEYSNKTSLSLWTIPPTNLSTLLTKTGLIQRFLFSVKEVPFEEYKLLRNEIIGNLGEKLDKEDQVERIARSLKTKSIPQEFSFDDEAIQLIKTKAEILDEMLVESGPQYVSQLKSFTVRRDLMMVKLSCHHAYLDERSTVQKQDVEYAFEVLEKLWNAFLAFCEEKWRYGDSRDKTVLEILEVGTRMEVNQFYWLVCERLPCRIALARRITNRLEKQGFVQRIGEMKKGQRFIERKR